MMEKMSAFSDLVALSQPKRKFLRTEVMSVAGLAAMIGFGACVAPTDEDDPDAEVGSAEQELRGGTVTTAATHRREVGRWGGCTATAIAPQWVIAAAHCWDYLDTIDTAATPHLLFQTSTDGLSWGAGSCVGCQSIETDRTIMLHSETALGRDDIALIRLRTPLNTSFLTPATLAAAVPTTGSVTTWGLGCTALGGGSDGKMRYGVSAAGAPTHMLCPGDSGGPRFAGTGRTGALFAVNSYLSAGGDGFGDVVAHRTEILNIMSSWESDSLSPDVDRGAFCPAPRQMHWGDVNADGLPDAICHDTSGGRIQVAENRNRHVRFVYDAGPVAFCTGAGAKLYTGDFTGDGRTDLLCRTPTAWGATLRTYVAQPTIAPRYRLADPAHQLLGTTWCTHASAQMLVGDFNGDRRTDLLCHDKASGAKWIRYTDASGRIPSTSTGEFFTDTHWCSHVGAELFTGDFNRDAKTDLLCFTRPTGYLHVQLSRGGSTPFSSWVDSELSTTLNTGLTCAADGGCADGQRCEAGTCRERLCTRSGKLLVGDFSGDKVSDVVCEYPTGRTFGVRPFAGLPSAGDGRAILQSTGGYFVGWGGKLRLRTLLASSQSWN